DKRASKAHAGAVVRRHDDIAVLVVHRAHGCRIEARGVCLLADVLLLLLELLAGSGRAWVFRNLRHQASSTFSSSPASVSYPDSSSPAGASYGGGGGAHRQAVGVV